MSEKRIATGPRPVLALLVALLAPVALAQKAAPVAVTTAGIEAVVREVTLTGSLTSPRRSRLAPEVDGRVTGIAAEAGDRVSEDAPLLRLDEAISRIELRRADARVREAQANLADARRRLREARDLAERDTIGQSELEARRAEVRQLEAVVAGREAEAALAREMLERHTLTAPFAGVINRRMVDVGERARTDRPVFELVAIERLRLELAVPQHYFGAVTTETDVRIRVDARPRRSIDARIDTVVPVSDAGSRTFLARVAIDNEAGGLTPGMSARATLRIETGRDSVVIPQDALIRYPDGRTVVWVAAGEGERRTVREQRVRTGLKFDGRIAIEDGLAAGAAVVTEGNEALQDGQEVRVTRRE